MVSSLMFGTAQFDNDIRALRSKRGMMEIVARGGWCWLAPRGYILDRSGGIPILRPDGELSHVIARALRGYYTKAEASSALTAAGMPAQTAHNIFLRPVLWRHHPQRASRRRHPRRLPRHHSR